MPAPDDAELHIPETPDALTADWLAATLGWPVDGLKQEVLGQGQGFLGDIIRLHIESQAAQAPASVIVKLPKKANRALGEMLGVYEREAKFFEEFGASLPVRIPEIFFSHYDPDAGSEKQKEILAMFDRLPRFMTPLIGFLGRKIATAKNRRYLVVMEDLSAFDAGDQFAGADPAACTRVLEQIAAAHREYWQATDTLDAHFWLLPLDIDARMREGMFRQLVPAFQAEATVALRPYVDWFADNSARLTRALVAEAPATLIHCDLRLDNICFQGSDCAFLDWQLTRSGPAAYDVAYFLGGSLRADATADEEDQILKAYHQALDRHDYPFDRFYRDYQRALLLSLPAVAPNDDIAIDAGRGQEMMARWRDRLEARLSRVNLATLLG